MSSGFCGLARAISAGIWRKIVPGMARTAITSMITIARRMDERKCQSHSRALSTWSMSVGAAAAGAGLEAGVSGRVST